MLSDKQVEIYKQINGSEEPADEKTKKDIERKCLKKRNVVQTRTEQIYLKHGLKLRRCTAQ